MLDIAMAVAMSFATIAAVRTVRAALVRALFRTEIMVRLTSKLQSQLDPLDRQLHSIGVGIDRAVSVANKELRRRLLFSNCLLVAFLSIIYFSAIDTGLEVMLATVLGIGFFITQWDALKFYVVKVAPALLTLERIRGVRASLVDGFPVG
jgi:hypothetical protein